MMGKFEQIKINWKKEFPHLIGAGVIYFILFWFTAQYFIEFVSAITGMTGLVCYMLFFNPQIKSFSIQFWLKSFAPYLLLLVILLGAKLFLTSYSIQLWENTRKVSMFQPGILFLLTLVLLLSIQRLIHKPFKITDGIIAATVKAKSSILNLFLIILFSQIIKEDISMEVAKVVDTFPAYWTGAIYNALGIGGAFITGSATMTNLLFKDLLSMADSSYIATITLAVGGALGNMISLQNIVLAKSVAPIHISEKEILSVTFYLVLLNWLFYQIMVAFL